MKAWLWAAFVCTGLVSGAAGAKAEEDYIPVLEREETAADPMPTPVQISSSPPTTLTVKAGNYTPEDAKTALDIVRKNCPLLDSAWDDVASVEVEVFEEFAAHRSSKGWKHTVGLRIRLSDNPLRMRALDEKYGAAGHVLHYALGGGTMPGMFATKRISQALCGLEVSESGADVFAAVPELSYLTRN